MDSTEQFDEINELLNKIEARLLKKISAMEISRTAKIPHKIVTIREIYAYRTVDFANSSVILLKQNKLIPAMVLIRSIMETNSILFRINELVIDSIKRRDSNGLDEEAMIVLCGSRDNNEEEIKSKNIMGYIDKITKVIPDYRYIYDSLSEYVHPNHDGCLGSYGLIDEDDRCTHLGFSIDKSDIIYSESIKFLFLNLELFSSEFDRNVRLIPELVLLCEEELKNNSN